MAGGSSVSLVNRPTVSAVRMRSSTLSSGCVARLVRYASSQLSLMRAKASCMLLTCGNPCEGPLREPIAQVAGDAVKERIAAGHDHHAFLAEIGFKSAHDFLQIG